MSATITPAKRRRNDTAASALSKPFKSPLRKQGQPLSGDPFYPYKQPLTPASQNQTLTQTQNSSSKGENQKQEDSSLSRQAKEEAKGSSSPPAGIILPSNDTHLPGLRADVLSRTQKQAQKQISATDPALAALLKTHRALQSRLAALRSELNTVSQAHHIEISSRDTELEALVTRWKAVAQDAADEVFAGARERLARMGGMMKYKEQVRSHADTRWNEEEGLDEEERKRWLEERPDLDMDEYERDKKTASAGGSKDSKKESGEEDEFTMGFMLKTLNINPKAIGFDLIEQRWIK